MTPNQTKRLIIILNFPNRNQNPQFSNFLFRYTEEASPIDPVTQISIIEATPLVIQQKFADLDTTIVQKPKSRLLCSTPPKRKRWLTWTQIWILGRRKMKWKESIEFRDRGILRDAFCGKGEMNELRIGWTRRKLEQRREEKELLLERKLGVFSFLKREVQTGSVVCFPTSSF